MISCCSRWVLTSAFVCSAQLLAGEIRSVDAASEYRLGIVCRERGDDRQAAIHLRAAVDAGFDNLAARVNLVEAAFGARQSTLALRTAKSLLDLPVRSIDVLLRVGRALFDHLFYREALTAFQKARELRPDAFEPRFRSALTSYLLQDYNSVVTALDRHVSNNPEAASLVSSAEAELGQFEDAERILRQAIEQAPDNPHAYINLALIDLDQGKKQDAEEMLSRLSSLRMKAGAKVFYTMKKSACGDVAKRIDTSQTDALGSREKAAFYYELAVQLEQGANYLSAVQLIDLSLSHGVKSAKALYVAAEGCLNQDPLSTEPVLMLKQAVRMEPGFAQAYYLLGRAFIRQGQQEEAANAFEHAARLHADPMYFVSLGKALKNQVPVSERRAAALAAYRRALEIDANSAPAHLELGRLLMELEQPDKARPELEKAIELEPDYYEAAYLLARFYHGRGDDQRSQQYMAQFAETKKVLLDQSVIGAGYLGDGR